MSGANEIWSIDDWCKSQTPSDWTVLPEASRLFLESLNLSSTHPFCHPDTLGAYRPYELEGVPPQGPLLHYDHLENSWDYLVTFASMAIPSLAAMGELWLRLFAFFIAPIGVLYLAYNDFFSKIENSKVSSRQKLFLSTTCLLTCASSVVLLTDTLYVLEFGPKLGGTLFTLSLVISMKTCWRYKLKWTLLGKYLLVMLLGLLIYDYETENITFGHPDDAVQIQEGLYYDASNSFISNLVQSHWPRQYWTYSFQLDATRWMPTGDSRTGLPFLLNKVPHPEYIRVWQPSYDDEVVALDIRFPDAGHDSSKPMYLLFHGLNGGSVEEYVMDFVWRRNAEGSTVIIMIARGLMDLPIRGFNCFHGARWQDGHIASQSIRAAMPEGQILAAVGYSMGAIILANLVGRTGSECALDAAVTISGGLDMRQQIHFHRAQRLWQPILTKELRDTFVLGKWGERVRHRLTKSEMVHLMRATHITEIDKTAVVAYNGFRDIVHYYSEMSLLGDVPYPSDEYYGDSLPASRRIHNISIPLCVIHALDDPLISWRTTAMNDGLMHPTNLTRTGSGNLLLLLTKRGGHVGWPLGIAPHKERWRWMNDAAMSFAEAVSKAKRNSFD